MSQEEIKSIYDALLSDGDLHILYPGMTGNWEKDQKKFSSQYYANEDLLSNLDLSDEY